MNKKILIIEDDPAIRLGLEDYLIQEGFIVIKADDGKAGFDLALSESPDLVLLDINLPTMDGIQVCRKLREHSFQKPIIVLTSRGEKIDMIVGLEVGADDYVTKPFDTRELLARIRTNLRRENSLVENQNSTGNKNKLQRHLLAIMFSDMENYSIKMNENEELALNILQVHNQMMKGCITKNSGKIIEIIGDAFLAVFESATECLNAGIEIQTEFRKYNLNKSGIEKINVRIGVHIGDVIEFEGKLKGDALNVAARIQEIAEPDKIYASENFYLTVKGKTQFHLKKHATVNLKNIKGELDIYVV